MILSLAGNFNRDSMLTRIEKIFPPSTQVPNDSFPQIAISQIQMPSGAETFEPSLCPSWFTAV